jgi:hypothetical protein
VIAEATLHLILIEIDNIGAYFLKKMVVFNFKKKQGSVITRLK